MTDIICIVKPRLNLAFYLGFILRPSKGKDGLRAVLSKYLIFSFSLFLKNFDLVNQINAKKVIYLLL